MIVTLVTALLSMSNDYVGLKRFYEATNGGGDVVMVFHFTLRLADGRTV